MSTNSIYQYFRSNYGEVEWVGRHTIWGQRLALVSFKHEENVEQVLQKKEHTIDGCILNASVADEIQEQCNLLSLNDDCISEILKYLNLENLCSVSNTCTRLRGLSQMKFSSDVKGKVFTLKENMHQLIDCLRNFGSQIQSIQLEKMSSLGAPGDIHILFLLATYCRSLISLELIDFPLIDPYLSEANIMQLIPMFSRLNKLILRKCQISDTVFSICDATELVLNEATIIMTDHSVEQRFSRLKTLSIRSEQRRINQRDRRLSSLTHFLNLLNASDSVEHIQMDIRFISSSSIGITNIFGVLSEFKNLKKLKVYSYQGLTISDSVEMLKKLTHLSELTLGYPRLLNSNELLNLIENGKHLKQLILTLYRGSGFESTFNALTFQEKLNILGQSRNGKQLNVINFISGESPFNVRMSADASIKITFIGQDEAVSIFRMRLL